MLRLSDCLWFTLWVGLVCATLVFSRVDVATLQLRVIQSCAIEGNVVIDERLYICDAVAQDGRGIRGPAANPERGSL